MYRIRYRIREVDGSDEDIAETLADLHRLTFFGSAPMADFNQGHWWFAYREATPIAFAGVIPSTHVHNAGYFCRVGVLSSHCGNRLQLRLMRAMEIASAAQWLECCRFRYHRQYGFRQQFYPRGL